MIVGPLSREYPGLRLFLSGEANGKTSVCLCRPQIRRAPLRMKSPGEIKNGDNGYIFESFFGRILSPFERFLRRTTAGGIILIGTSAVTLALANSGAGGHLLHVLEQPVRIGSAGWFIELTLHSWINEGLMTLFFLLLAL